MHEVKTLVKGIIISEHGVIDWTKLHGTIHYNRGTLLHLFVVAATINNN
jgi:hypothetical protein